MAYPAAAIANAFIALAREDGEALSNMKLQKLLYFAQGHSYSLRDQALIEDDAQAWDYGPVYATVYHQLKRYGAGDIKSPISDPYPDFEGEDCNPWAAPGNPEVTRFIRAIWKAYRSASPIKLSEMSHVPNGPWSLARKRQPNQKSVVIPKEDIANYFKGLKGEQGEREA